MKQISFLVLAPLFSPSSPSSPLFPLLPFSYPNTIAERLQVMIQNRGVNSLQCVLLRERNVEDVE